MLDLSMITAKVKGAMKAFRDVGRPHSDYTPVPVIETDFPQNEKSPQHNTGNDKPYRNGLQKGIAKGRRGAHLTWWGLLQALVGNTPYMLYAMDRNCIFKAESPV